MMPPLPLAESASDKYFPRPRAYFSEEQMLAYGRAVAEACAKVCEDVANEAEDAWPEDVRTIADQAFIDAKRDCAAAIREMAKE